MMFVTSRWRVIAGMLDEVVEGMEQSTHLFTPSERSVIM